jgi:hypothetical protein
MVESQERDNYWSRTTSSAPPQIVVGSDLRPVAEATWRFHQNFGSTTCRHIVGSLGLDIFLRL